MAPEVDESVDESKSVTRGTLWLIISMCSCLIMALGSIAASGAASWARTIEDRGIQNERRISSLEASYSAINAKLDASTERQKDVLELLRQHMKGTGQ